MPKIMTNKENAGKRLPTSGSPTKWLVTTDAIKRKFGWEFLGVIKAYARVNSQHPDRVFRCLSAEFRSIPNTDNASVDDKLEWNYWLDDTIKMDKDFADILADRELITQWRQRARLFDERPKSLYKRFFNKLRDWALAWERRRQYRRGKAEAWIIIQQYRKSPDTYINGLPLYSALQRRQDELWDEWNGRSFRLSTRDGFACMCDKFSAEIHATRPGA